MTLRQTRSRLNQSRSTDLSELGVLGTDGLEDLEEALKLVIELD
jgi:hypothetical protein